MVERNGPILFVKPFASPDALELECNLNAQETYVLEAVCPDYSVTCVNKSGKNNKKDLPIFKKEIVGFEHIVLMGKQCCKMLNIDYTEWGHALYHLGDQRCGMVWFAPSFGKIMSSPKNLKRLRSLVNEIKRK